MRRILLALLMAGVIALQPALPWGAASADSRGQTARTVAFDAAENTPDPSATPTLDLSASPAEMPASDPSAATSEDPNLSPLADPSATPTSDPSATLPGDPDLSPSADPTETPAEMELPMLLAVEAIGTTYNLATINKGLSLSIEVGGVPYTPGMEIARGSAIKLVLIYRLQNEGGSNLLTGLDTLEYAFPQELKMTDVNNGDVYDGSTRAGTFSINNNVLRIQLLQAYLDANGTSEMRGTLRLSGKFDLAEIADGDVQEIKFPRRNHHNCHVQSPECVCE